MTTPAKVLIIDNDENDAFFLSRALTSLQQKKAIELHIEIASSVADAQTLLRNNPQDAFALIFLDLLIPDGGGIGFLASFREDARFDTTPVVVTTSALDEDIRKGALEAGARRVYQKPDRLREITKLVEESLDDFVVGSGG